jgi:hypothetical protein
MKTFKRLCFLLAFAMITVGCGPQKVVKSTMSINDQQRLSNKLIKLESILKKNAPFIQKKLASEDAKGIISFDLKRYDKLEKEYRAKCDKN